MSSVDILVPDLPESVADATSPTWHKKPGDAVVRDEVLVEIETDKVVLEVPASADGILDAVLEEEGTTVTSRQILGRLREGNSAGKETSAKSEEKASTRHSDSRRRWKNKTVMRSARRSVACWLSTIWKPAPSKAPASAVVLPVKMWKNIWRKTNLKRLLLNLQHNPLWARAAKNACR
nr:dihydrolipoamide succinyltransferase component (E2) [Salmonella sp. NCTC 7297]